MAAPATSVSLPVLVITGVGGIGLAVAQRLGSGHQIVLADFSPETLQEASALLQRSGFLTTTHQVDVSDRASTTQLAAAAAALGTITTVVHTAGLSPALASAERIYAVNLIGTVNIIDAFAHRIAPHGAMVCLGSVAGVSLRAQLTPADQLHLAAAPVDELLAGCAGIDVATDSAGVAYGVSKRANVLRVQSAALAYGARGVRINVVSPNITATGMGQKELDGADGDMIRGLQAASPLKRVGTPNEIADAVAFLASSQASFITGIELGVDGGASGLIRAQVLQAAATG